jgi:hypothetical protein
MIALQLEAPLPGLGVGPEHPQKYKAGTGLTRLFFSISKNVIALSKKLISLYKIIRIWQEKIIVRLCLKT